ncbi:MAG: BACON domain-containing carbohydrate-binding protein [Bacteroidales bacterium]
MRNKISILGLIVVLPFLVMNVLSCGKNDNPAVEPPKNPAIEIIVADVTIPDISTGSATATFTTSEPWSLELSDTKATPDWFDVSPKSGGAGSATLTISTTKANESYDDRSAYIKIKVGSVTKNITVTQKKKEALLLTKDRYEISPEGGRFNVEVKSNVSYQVTIHENSSVWITRDVKSKALSTTNESFVVLAGSLDGNREGMVVFSSGNLKDTVHVYQAKKNGLILTTKAVNIDETAQNFDVELKSNVDYAVSFINGGWLRKVETRSTRVDRLSFAADKNTDYDSRTMQVVFKDKNSALADTLTVVQAQKGALILSNKNYTLNEKGGEIEVELKTNVEYDIIMPATKQWLTRVQTKGLNSYKHNFLIGINTDDEERSAEVIFKDRSSSITDTLYVKQDKKKSLLFKDREMILSLFAADTFAVIASNLNYELTIRAKDTTWIKTSTTPFTKALKEDKIYLRVKSNFNRDNREGQVIIKEFDGNKVDTLFIRQQGTASYDKPTLWLENDIFKISKDGGVIHAKLWANIDYRTIIDKQWVTQSVETKGMDLLNEKFVIAPNLTTTARTAKITFESTNNPALFTSLTIIQEENTKSTNPDSLILVRIYNEAAGENWKTKWDLTKPINTWKGVTLTKVETGEKRVTGLDISQQGVTGKVNITGLTYLNEFSAVWNKNISFIKADSLEFLTSLTADDNAISTIEFSHLPSLETLGLSMNKLTSFVATDKDFPNLISLSLSDNKLTEISVKNLDKLTELYINKVWSTEDANPIEHIDISGCKLLKSFSGGISNVLKTFKAKGCTKLIGNAEFGLTFSNHADWSPYCLNLVCVDVSGCESIPALYFSNPKLENLDITGCTSVSQMIITVANLQLLDISGLAKLKYLNISEIKASKFSITGGDLPLLTSISCNESDVSSLSIDVLYTGSLTCEGNKNLVSFSVRNSSKIHTLRCSDNLMLQELDLSGMKEMVQLHIFPGKLKTLNISRCSKLATIFYTASATLENFIAKDCISLNRLDFGMAPYGQTCNNPVLKNVDVSNCTALTSIGFWSNPLERLVLNNCTALTSISMSKTTLPVLDVSGLTSLKTITCLDNASLTQLVGIQDCSNIESIHCTNNRLSGEFSLKGMAKLTTLKLAQNALTSIAVSAHPLLTSVVVSSNKLTSATFSDLKKVTDIECYNNPVETIYVANCPVLAWTRTTEPCKIVNYRACPVLNKQTSWSRIIGYDIYNKPILEYLPKYVVGS